MLDHVGAIVKPAADVRGAGRLTTGRAHRTVQTRGVGSVLVNGRVGLIVNPIAGMGGSVGLKGTDGGKILAEARLLGATPRAPARTAQTLESLARGPGELGFLTGAGAMGEEEARTAGLSSTVVGSAKAGDTTAEDTKRIAASMLGAGVDLLLFAGGDGTARDILVAIGDGLPVLGIPAGVKIHSACFATSPRAAGELARSFLTGRTTKLRDSEVMDVDEEALRRGVMSAHLFGFLKVPYLERLLQGAKSRSRSEEAALSAIASAVIEQMGPGTAFVFGPGTTTRAVMATLGLEATLAGVDVVRDGRLLAADVNERRLLELVANGPAKIVVAPVGGQGYIFGRGNQQISAGVIDAVGAENVIVVATPGKLASLRGKPLLVDTEDEDVNELLAGFTRVVVGLGEEAIYAVGR